MLINPARSFSQLLQEHIGETTLTPDELAYRLYLPPTTVIGWLMGRELPKEREDVIALGKHLNLSDASLDALLFAAGHEPEYGNVAAGQEASLSATGKTEIHFHGPVVGVTFGEGSSVRAGTIAGGDVYKTGPLAGQAKATRWQPIRLAEPFGRYRDLASLQALYDDVRQSGSGQAAFLMGSFGTGRWGLAQAMIEYAHSLGDYAETADLVGSDPLTYGRFVRDLTRQKPLLLFVDCLEREETVWLDALLRIVTEAAGSQEQRPLLLLVTLTAFQPLAQMSGEDHTEPTRFAQKLERDGLAEIYHMGHLTAADIEASIAPANPDLVQRLHQLSGGGALWADLIWQEWQAVPAVVQDEAGVWQARSLAAAELGVYGDVADQARRWLSRCLDAAGEDCPFTLTEAERILNCAATEGFVFTAEAVAEVMELDKDDLIDFFDDVVGPYNELDDYDLLADGIVAEVGAVQMDPYQPERHAWEYRFSQTYFYYVWASHPVRKSERQQWQRELGIALHELYHPYIGAVADKLAVLFPSLAQSHTQRQERRVSLDTLRHYVNLLREDDLENQYVVYRLFELGFILLARLGQERPQLWQEGVDLAKYLYDLAERWGDETYSVDGLYYQAVHFYEGGHYAAALPLARKAVERCVGESKQEARCLNILGLVLHAMGDLAEARPYVERTLAIAEKSLGPDHPDTANSLNNLGYLLYAMGDLAEVRSYLERALAIQEKSFGPDHPHTARSLNSLGGLLQAMGDLAGARPYYERTLAICEKSLGPDHPHTAISLNNLGRLLQDMGDLAAARPLLERALQIREDRLGPDHPDTLSSRKALAVIKAAIN